MFEFVDLCCGIGAFHMVLSSLGGKCALAADIDANAKQVYANNFGSPKQWFDDIYDIDRLPPHQVLCAGFPCQPFSVAGKRMGRADSRGRGTIVYHIMSLLRKCAVKPTVVVFENVYGILNVDGGIVANYVVRSLVSLGYEVRVVQVDAVDAGSPIHRKRVFFVGCKKTLAGEPDFGSKRRVLKDIFLPKPDAKWLDPSKYVILPQSQWTRKTTGKVFVGYYKRAGMGPEPWKESAHSQGARIWHATGIAETFTSTHKCFVYVPSKGVRPLSIEEMYACMGFPKSFKRDLSKQRSMRQISNSINVFALRPILKWALGCASLTPS
jgi:DNA (cytosine-5)-methyltransferase 1